MGNFVRQHKKYETTADTVYMTPRHKNYYGGTNANKNLATVHPLHNSILGAWPCLAFRATIKTRGRETY